MKNEVGINALSLLHDTLSPIMAKHGEAQRKQKELEDIDRLFNGLGIGLVTAK